MPRNDVGTGNLPDPEPDGPRYGGANGGPLISSVMSPAERIVRQAIDHFDEVHLPGSGNWLMRQRMGRLCEEIIDGLERLAAQDTHP